MFPSVGQTDEELERYELTHSKVILAAERTQRSAKAFVPRDLSALADRFTDIIENPSGNDETSYRNDLISMNVPICDLDTVDLAGYCDVSFKKTDANMQFCIYDFISRNCAKATIGSEKFPYEFDARFDNGRPRDLV